MFSGDNITLAIPVYNGAKFIEKAVYSVIKQTIVINKIIIVDDASNDNTPELVKDIKKKFPSRDIQYFKNNQNLGYPANWNRCFNLCKTIYLVILHQDDELIENAVEKQLYFFQNHPEVALVGGLEDFIDINGNVIKRNKRKQTRIYQKGQIYEFVTETGSYIPCSSVMFDMEKIIQVGYFDEDVIATDELYWPKILTKYPIAILGESLIYRRSHPGQTEYGDFVRYEEDAVEIYKKFNRIIDYEQRPELKGKVEKFLQYKFSRSWIGIAANVAKQGYRWIAVKYIFRAIRIKPSIIFYFPKMWKTFAKMLIFFLGIRLGKNAKS